MITVYDANTTLEQLREVEVQTPANAGSTWAGIQHGELVDAIMDECDARKWEVIGGKYSLARQGADLAGAIGVRIPDMDVPDGIEMGIGFMTSNARRKALRMYVGGTVSICNNGLATGNIVLNKKHSLHTDLYGEVERGLDKYRIAAQALPATVAELKDKKLTASKAVAVLDKALDRELMGVKLLWKVQREYYNPRHAEHGVPVDGVGTGWALLNAFTEMVKQCPPQQQLTRIDTFRGMVLAA